MQRSVARDGDLRSALRASSSNGFDEDRWNQRPLRTSKWLERRFEGSAAGSQATRCSSRVDAAATVKEWASPLEARSLGSVANAGFAADS